MKKKKHLSYKRKNLYALSGFIRLFILLTISTSVYAHHILGRPSYGLSEDSTTPPSMQVETQLGNYYVTYMVFPAFPVPDEPGRVNLYITHIDTGKPYIGKVTFKALSGNLINRHESILGVQLSDDNVYRQGYVFHKAGDYLISAEFESDGEPYKLDFPLQIGAPMLLGPIGFIISFIMIVLIAVNLFKRKTFLIEKIRSNRNRNIQENFSTPQK